MARRGLGPTITAAAVALLLAVGFAATRFSGLQGGTASLRDAPAPELVGIEAWLNGEPRTLQELRGKVVLIDFWTYSCINCIRTLPHLRALYRTYRPYGLEVIGVHSPEFAFERDVGNVRAALERYRVLYPVALDNGMQTWDAFGNRYWPHVYLIDAQGTIRFDHIGEGGEEQIQSQIRTLMSEAGLGLPAPVDLTSDGPSAQITPEVYAGARRGTAGGHLGNREGYRVGAVTDYAPVDPDDLRTADTRGVFFLEGPWRAEAEYIESAGPGARVRLAFFARDVFMVAAGEAAIAVSVDDQPIRRGAAGADVVDATVNVNRSDLFGVIRLPAPARHVLTLEAMPGLRLYTFTFG